MVRVVMDLIIDVLAVGDVVRVPREESPVVITFGSLQSHGQISSRRRWPASKTLAIGWISIAYSRTSPSGTGCGFTWGWYGRQG